MTICTYHDHVFMEGERIHITSYAYFCDECVPESFTGKSVIYTHKGAFTDFSENEQTGCIECAVTYNVAEGKTTLAASRCMIK